MPVSRRVNRDGVPHHVFSNREFINFVNFAERGETLIVGREREGGGDAARCVSPRLIQPTRKKRGGDSTPPPLSLGGATNELHLVLAVKKGRMRESFRHLAGGGAGGAPSAF